MAVCACFLLLLASCQNTSARNNATYDNSSAPVSSTVSVPATFTSSNAEPDTEPDTTVFTNIEAQFSSIVPGHEIAALIDSGGYRFILHREKGADDGCSCQVACALPGGGIVFIDIWYSVDRYAAAGEGELLLYTHPLPLWNDPEELLHRRYPEAVLLRIADIDGVPVLSAAPVTAESAFLPLTANNYMVGSDYSFAALDGCRISYDSVDFLFGTSAETVAGEASFVPLTEISYQIDGNALTLTSSSPCALRTVTGNLPLSNAFVDVVEVAETTDGYTAMLYLSPYAVAYRVSIERVFDATVFEQTGYPYASVLRISFSAGNAVPGLPQEEWPAPDGWVGFCPHRP